MPMAHAQSTSDLPIALVGEATGASIDDATFEVYVWSDIFNRNVEVGQVARTRRLNNAIISVQDSKFTVQVNPADIPPGYIVDDYAHVEVMIFKPGRQLIGDVEASVRVVTDGLDGVTKWADASATAAQGPVPADEASPTINPAQVSVDVSQASTPQEVEVAACGGSGWKLETTSDRMGKIAHTFVPDGTTSVAWAYHSTNRSHTLGLANKTGSGAWVANTSSKTLSAGVSFEWAKNSAVARAYRMEINYGRYRYQEETIDGDCRWFDSWKWSPRWNTGGYGNLYHSTQPTWGRDYCAPVPAGTWKRQRTDGSDFSLSAGVEISGLIGVDLSSKRSYASNAFIAYSVVGNKKLCGSNHDPAYARDVRMAKTW